MDATIGTVIVACIAAAASLLLGLMNRRAAERTSVATGIVREEANARLLTLKEHVEQLQDEVARLKRVADANRDVIDELKSDLRECLRARDAGERERLLLLEKIVDRRQP